MRYYPLYADLRGRPCLVVGRGSLAEEKAASLERAGARVRRRETFEPEDARDVFLIVADVPPDEAARIQRFGDAHCRFVNIVDKPRHCSFILPAILERDDLLVAVGTSGSSPAMAGWIRRQLESQFGPEYPAVLRALGRTREEVKARIPEYADRKRFYRELLDGGLLDIARNEGAQAAETRLRSRIEVWDPCRSSEANEAPFYS